MVGRRSKRSCWLVCAALGWTLACDAPVDGPDARADARPPDGASVRDATPGAPDLMHATPDAIGGTDVMPDAMGVTTDAMVDAMNAMSDAIMDASDGMPDAMVAMPDTMPDAMPDTAAPPIRAPCFVGEAVDSGLEPAPRGCFDIFAADPTAETGCYLFDDGDGGLTEGYCWRRRALIVLVNNDIDAEPLPDDIDGDGVVDRGPLAGINFPPDPLEATPAETAERMAREIRSWYREVSYDGLWLDAGDIHYVPQSEAGPARWFRLQQLRPGFAHRDIFREVCRQRGGMTPADWRAFDFIVTVVTDGTATSGSQKRTEALPVGEDCAETVDIRGDYIVAKRFGSWSRLGTLFHELGHGLGRDPADEPSIGHSEATHAVDGTSAEYGDLTDVMGESSDRGHFSLPQKAFMRMLPRETIIDVSPELPVAVHRIHPLERDVLETKGLMIRVEQGRTYYVEARRAIGADARLDALFHQGALIKRANAIDGANKSWIIDPTPESATVRSDDSVLLPGRTYRDAANGLSISALASDDDGVTIEVRRGPPSAAPPEVEGVELADDGETLVARARPGSAEVPADELLYFWKPGARSAVLGAGGWRSGPTVRFPGGPPDRELWLLVSDRRGGEAWYQARPAP